MNKLQFIIAGNATFTLYNTRTGNRFTYRVKAPAMATEKGGHVLDHTSDARFVQVLTGPDNEQDYAFIGTIFKGTHFYYSYRKSHITKGALSVRAFEWAWKQLREGLPFPDYIHLHHAGHCGRCGRTLTVPESLISGFGPECITKI